MLRLQPLEFNGMSREVAGCLRFWRDKRALSRRRKNLAWGSVFWDSIGTRKMMFRREYSNG